MRNFFLFFIIFTFFLKSICFGHSLKERFIVIGHLYPIINDNLKFESFVKKVNSYKPNYIFILGDSEIQDKKIYEKYIDSFNAEIFVSLCPLTIKFCKGLPPLP